MSETRAIALPSGGALHIEGDPRGPSVLLLHGVGGAAWSWEPQRRALAERFRIFTWEARGHGRAAPVADAGFADYLVDAREALDVAAANGAVLVAGHSMGGLIAIMLAADGQPVRALALIDPVYNEHNDAHVPPPLRPLANALAAPLIGSTRRGGRFARIVGRAVFNASFTDRAAREVAWRAQREQVPFEYPRMFTEGIGGVSGVAFRSFARDIRVPTLLLNGRFPTLRDQLRASLGERFIDVTMPGGHYLQLDRPAAVSERLRRFFDENAAT